MEINQRILPTPDMIRSARGYLNWSQHELGQRCNLSKVSLVGIESGRQKPNHETLKRIAGVFWNEGLVFLESGGFRVDESLIKILEGIGGVKVFFEDVAKTAKETGGKFLVSGVNQKIFEQALEETGIADRYYNDMNVLFKNKKVSYKTIISKSEKDKNEIKYCDYSQYKYVKDDKFANVPFYVYGDRLAIIFWKKVPKIILIDDAELVDAYRKTFDVLWEQSSPV